MQIIEFLPAKQQRNVFDDIDYLSNMSKAGNLVLTTGLKTLTTGLKTLISHRKG